MKIGKCCEGVDGCVNPYNHHLTHYDSSNGEILTATQRQDARADQASLGCDFIRRGGHDYIRTDIHDATLKERDEWRAKAEHGPQASDEKWNELVEFWQKKANAREHLADTCGTLRTANMELLAENAQLRRKLEKLERKK